MNDLPLTDAELDELEDFLDRDGLPQDCMDISMLDGFFTALAIGPNTLLPGQWLPVVWGETESEPMAFDSAEEMQRIIELVMRFYNDRIDSLAEDVDEYSPLIYEEDTPSGNRIPLLASWCVGFISALELDPGGWRPLVENEDSADAALLTPMLLLGTEDGWRELQENPALQDKKSDLADIIPTCVIGIRNYWLPHRKVASTFRRETEKVGRNDPCPCGSGKKFKKCCGSGEKLH